ncbi:hypothetical protein HYH02_012321 [Chlamydomonas schloesseri]|uniref:Uncharacterized protein n=1 Tax=Chlamydomonas schloesseri TaxID=2026947 RepID=A0A835TAI6_9CHLO|nr:hypothetical protein HYH02_012321 [Chlamydomonas schloesseri]|eukprot:KAG2434495.1 hypothetical protein HYH02_012321 [Chlamydomonas schloesseri]
MLRTEDLAATWVRLAKVSKEPTVRTSPELQKFVDILACATIDRIQQLSISSLCSIIWASSKLKKGLGHSGMFKSFLKAWAAEMEVHLEHLNLEQSRKVMAAITRVNYQPSAPWKMKMEATLTANLAHCACPKTLACCLVSAASLGFSLHPAPAFREAVGAACGTAFAGAAGAPPPAAARRIHGPVDVARCACSTLWAAAVLGVPLPGDTVRSMLGHITFVGVGGLASGLVASASSPFPSLESVESTLEGTCFVSEGGPGLAALDFAQVYWALSKVAYKPSKGEMAALLDTTAAALPTTPPVLLATILWALADLEVVPPEAWLQRAYSSFERQLDGASAEPLQALLHAAATLQLPPPQWSSKLMERLQDVDLRVLPDGNIVDLVMSMHALRMHPPQQLAVTLQQECIQRLSLRGATAAAAEAGCRVDGGDGGAPQQPEAGAGASA